MYKQIVLKPHLSEQAYQLSQTGNTYVLRVPLNANKHTVARAVAAQFDVTVETVNIANIQGKPKRVVAKGGRRVSNGSRTDVKKAYVKLAAGQTLPFFEAEKAEEKKAEQAEKKAEKKGKK
jgi:large subunit ribosomal protein L23